MGIDTPIAVLSDKHQPLFNYFKQRFAQVTNPPIDAIREEIVTSTTIYVGKNGNVLEEKPENCQSSAYQSSDSDEHGYAEDQEYEGARLQGGSASDHLL